MGGWNQLASQSDGGNQLRRTRKLLHERSRRHVWTDSQHHWLLTGFRWKNKWYRINNLSLNEIKTPSSEVVIGAWVQVKQMASRGVWNLNERVQISFGTQVITLSQSKEPEWPLKLHRGAKWQETLRKAKTSKSSWWSSLHSLLSVKG